ncbi:MAG TPA: very short patch repair endonuclease [Phycisphaerae bacterium]|nr:very short patch repair endonuclease [Phycisphaerae bacterium]HQL76297.1 very short patch repair endonuclease [Phycisphaerae bacterium]
MVDVLTSEQRRLCMSRIRGKDTKPEMVVRRLVHGLGHRYRLHCHDLPGCPDIVFRRQRLAIFVHGCFWHRHKCRYGQVMPATRRAFWRAKLEGNRDRDMVNLKKLRKLGYKVLVIWECQTRKPESVLSRIAEFLEA